MTLRGFIHHDGRPGEDGPYMAVPRGYHWRFRLYVKRTLRGRHRLPYSLSTHDKARQIGPAPLPFKHRRRKW